MSYSVNTNASALAALQTLNQTQRSLQMTQGRINSGYKVGSAQDDASTFAIAQGMRGDIAGLKSVSDNIALGMNAVSVASNAATQISNKMQELMSKVTQATSDQVDHAKIQQDVDSILQQIEDIGAAAQFNGTNLLSNTTTASTATTAPANLTVVTSLNRTSATAVTTGTQVVNGQDLRIETLFGTGNQIVTVANSGSGTATGTLSVTTSNNVSSLVGTGSLSVKTSSDAKLNLAAIQNAILAVNKAVAQLGTDYNHLQAQGDFVKSLTDTLTTGVGNLVDADLSEESANLQALQTKQQLGIQALSIANQSSSAVLSLFR